MSAFDLSDALDSSSEGEGAAESSCFDVPDVQEEVIRLEDGLDLKVSRGRNMKSVANLVLVVNTFKKFMTPRGRKLSEEELCSVILNTVVEETIVKTVRNPTTGEKQHVLKQLPNKTNFTLSDMTQKSVIHQSGEFKLQAITLKGGYSQYKVNFEMSRYACVDGDATETILLSVSKTLHMSCSMKDGKVTLNLEECSESLNEISYEKNMDRFLFYKRTRGVSLTSFESFKYRGWFISTSPEDGHDEPISEMCMVDTAMRYTQFRIKYN